MSNGGPLANRPLPAQATAFQREAERLRQEGETFDQRKLQDSRRALLSLITGYASVLVFFPGILIVSGTILLNPDRYDPWVVRAAAGAFLVDAFAIIGGAYRLVMRPAHADGVAPVTVVDPTAAQAERVSPASPAVVVGAAGGGASSTSDAFSDDFDAGLSAWQYSGGWTLGSDQDGPYLTVTESGAGGLAQQCRGWRNYVVEFDTKIIRGNSSWIVRAPDLESYAMIQCGVASLRPHFRVGGKWFVPTKEHPLPLTVPLDKWVGVRLVVIEDAVSAFMRLGTDYAPILTNLPLDGGMLRVSEGGKAHPEEGLVRLSFPRGSFGFRESGEEEHACFRRVRARRLVG